MSAFGDSKEQQALIRHLADTLVQNEVIEPMDRIEWGHGTPPAPRVEGQPPVVEGAPAPTPEAPPVVKDGQPVAPAAPVAKPEGETKANPSSTDITALVESMKDPKTGLYGGKYTSFEETVKGMGHLTAMSRQAFEENARLRAQLAELAKQPAASPAAAPIAETKIDASPAPVAVRSEKLAEVLGRLSEGETLDAETLKALTDGISDQSSLSARQAARDILAERDNAAKAENAKWERVNEFMEKEHPGSTRFTDDVALFVSANPLIAEGVNALVAKGQEIRAAELAWSEFDKARGATIQAQTTAEAQAKETRLAAADQVRQEAVDQARKDAGILPTSASGVHETVVTGASREEIDAAAAGMRQQGTAPGSAAAAKWRSLTIGSGLTGPMFDGP